MKVSQSYLICVGAWASCRTLGQLWELGPPSECGHRLHNSRWRCVSLNTQLLDREAMLQTHRSYLEFGAGDMF
jgi:hypothetical protein